MKSKQKKFPKHASILKDNPLPSARANLLKTPPSPTDPLGSYTGKPADSEDKPTQDADDL